MQHYGSACNEERYELYYGMFTDLLRGHHDGDARVETRRANLMIDIRWPEVSRALSDVVCHLCGTWRRNCHAPLAHDIGRLMERAATIAFGTSRHPEIPSWFLQNNECLLAATLHKMLVEFVTSGEFIIRYTDAMVRNAFGVLLDIAEGMRNCLGLSYLADSTGAHALMSAVTNSKYDFLSKDTQILHRSERIFASVLAERVVADPNRAMELRSGSASLRARGAGANSRRRAWTATASGRRLRNCLPRCTWPRSGWPRRGTQASLPRPPLASERLVARPSHPEDECADAHKVAALSDR